MAAQKSAKKSAPVTAKQAAPAKKAAAPAPAPAKKAAAPAPAPAKKAAAPAPAPAKKAASPAPAPAKKAAAPAPAPAKKAAAPAPAPAKKAAAPAPAPAKKAAAPAPAPAKKAASPAPAPAPAPAKKAAPAPAPAPAKKAAVPAKKQAAAKPVAKLSAALSSGTSIECVVAGAPFVLLVEQVEPLTIAWEGAGDDGTLVYAPAALAAAQSFTELTGGKVAFGNANDSSAKIMGSMPPFLLSRAFFAAVKEAPVTVFVPAIGDVQTFVPTESNSAVVQIGGNSQTLPVVRFQALRVALDVVDDAEFPLVLRRQDWGTETFALTRIV
jgi:hypothetical protein